MELSLSQNPLISVIIPARNEEQYLPKCLNSIRLASQRLPSPVEVIVVINNCTDNTETIAQDSGCVVTKMDDANLSQIINAGAKQTHGSIIVTIDADSTISPNTFYQILTSLSAPQTIGGRIVMLPERWSLGIFLTALCLLPFIFRYGLPGGLFFCRRLDFETIGGFNESLNQSEGSDFAGRLKSYGKKKNFRYKTISNAFQYSSCRKFDRLGDWYFLLHPRHFHNLLGKRNQIDVTSHIQQKLVIF